MDLIDEATVGRGARIWIGTVSYLMFCVNGSFRMSGISQVSSKLTKVNMCRLPGTATAIRNYRLFCQEDRYLFAPNEAFEQIISDMVALEEMKSQPTKPEDFDERTEELRAKIDQAFLSVVRSTTSGLTAERKAKAKKALASRLLMALGGGLALVGPMLVMVLHPTRLTAVFTASVCVVAAAVLLAVYMVDSQPKDVLACTAAYAAVLVVFVGAGGGLGG